MIQDLLVLTARFLKGVGQDRHPIEGSLLIDRLGQFDHDSVTPGQPGWVDWDWAEGVSEDTTQKPALFALLSLGSCEPDLARVIRGEGVSHRPSRGESRVFCSEQVIHWTFLVRLFLIEIRTRDKSGDGVCYRSRGIAVREQLRRGVSGLSSHGQG